MNSSNKIIAFGVAVGIAAFVTAGLVLTVAARRSSTNVDLVSTPPPLKASVIAPAQALSRAFEAVAAQIKPAVVSVLSEKVLKLREQQSPSPFGGNLFQWFFGQQGQSSQPQQPQYREYKVPERGLGSGIIIDKQGHILTNYHVVKGMTKLKVTLADNRTFDAVVVGTDPKTDVAIIRIKGTVPADLPVAHLGNSGKLKVGQLVIAVGAPFGYVQTVTSGIISATGRANVGLGDYEDFLQTDAAINPGNSGGPLVNMQGQVIGMNTAIATSVGQFSGVGFAIPINVVRSILPVLLKGGKVKRGMLGVMIQDLNSNLAQQFGITGTEGALVSQVNSGSPAAKAGIEVGDVIVRYNGKKVKNTFQLRNLVAGTAPGTRVKIEVIRNSKKKTLTVKVGNLSEEASTSSRSTVNHSEPLSKYGVTIKPLTSDRARQYGIEQRKGVVITSVTQDSPAGMAGLQAGDLIQEVDRHRVSSVDDVAKVLAKSQGKKRVLLLINRKGMGLFVILNLP